MHRRSPFSAVAANRYLLSARVWTIFSFVSFVNPADFPVRPAAPLSYARELCIRERITGHPSKAHGRESRDTHRKRMGKNHGTPIESAHRKRMGVPFGVSIRGFNVSRRRVTGSGGRARQDVEPGAYRDVFTASAAARHPAATDRSRCLRSDIEGQNGNRRSPAFAENHGKNHGTPIEIAHRSRSPPLNRGAISDSRRSASGTASPRNRTKTGRSGSPLPGSSSPPIR